MSAPMTSRISERGAAIAAGRLHITVEEYRRHEANGEAWCSGCQDWHDRDEFRTNPQRANGLAAYCRSQSNAYDSNRHLRMVAADQQRRFSGISYAGPAFSKEWKRVSLTPEGARTVSRADSAQSEPAASCAQPVRVPSGHLHCPAVLGCRDGRLPWGWVRERKDGAA